MHKGLEDAGLESGAFDLTGALLITLTRTDTRSQWLAGKPVFEQAAARLFLDSEFGAVDAP